ncbi:MULTISPECIES: SDR family oxidoreductase [unclassified Chryseobacterium]|uniref:SDR family oxidoreductase n=1 Tax=unclassified Chryseobacterium TaxID=2593645 RepID=UPI000914D316|nr:MULTISPECIES: SDR family oxidoreductase [unclassified Chryseobacterium]SHE90373.1 Short-chain dehydrogenase [Chryseobacterium sp. OV279]HCA05814.1 SDR family NAD(P)-dependent oxidoreductase [Chryseobacterium sp.]
MQKTIFITGASSGLGKTTAKLFQSKGWNVIATMRNPEAETELTQLEKVTVLKLDVTNSQELNETVDYILGNYNVDVVLNNAGYGLIGPLEAFTDEQIKMQIETNLMGVIRITKGFTPYFREKKDGVLINITSSFGLIGFPTCSVYSATKFAVDGFSESMGYELAQFGIKVKIVAPGGIQTDFAGRSLDGATHEAYGQLVAKVSEGYSPEQISNYSKPEDIARVIYEAATDGKDQLRYIAGKDANALYDERAETGSEAQVQRIKSDFVF